MRIRSCDLIVNGLLYLDSHQKLSVVHLYIGIYKVFQYPH